MDNLFFRFPAETGKKLIVEDLLTGTQATSNCSSQVTASSLPISPLLISAERIGFQHFLTESAEHHKKNRSYPVDPV
jgi:hypothetical protein